MGIEKMIRNIMGREQTAPVPQTPVQMPADDAAKKRQSIGDEQFALVNIEDDTDAIKPADDPTLKIAEATAEAASRFSWPKINIFRREKPTVPEQLRLDDGEEIRMVDAEKLLEMLKVGISHQSGGRIDSYSLLTASGKLEEMGLSMMPDGRCPFRVKVNDLIAVYRRPDGQDYPLTYRSVQQTVIYLAAWLIQGGEVTPSDLALIDEWIDANAPKDRSTLPQRGMLRWLLSRKRILSKRVKTRATSQMARFVHKRASALDLLLRLAANAPQSHDRIKNLEKLFPLMGLDANDVHSQLHRLATGKAAEKPAAKAKATVTIDPARLIEMEHNTRKAQDILHNVFADEPEPEAAESAPQKTESITEALYNKVKERTEWTADEFERLVRPFGLSPMAALEDLNEYSYELNDEPLLEEDGDVLLVNQI